MTCPAVTGSPPLLPPRQIATPPAVMARSDAGFNLGAAIAALNLLEPGVYISMSGRIFPAESVRKDRSRGIFEG